MQNVTRECETPTRGKCMSESATDTRQVMEAFVEMTNERDYSRLPDICAESFTWETPAAPGGEVRGYDEAEDVIEKIVSGFPDFSAELTDVLTSDDKGMAVVRFTGSHEGEYEGIPPTGQEFELVGMSRWTVADGKIQELRDCANMQELVEQLGVAEE